ncbi:hypothetical protein [Robbsia sp. KACC 23696]|uniref:hypothetical protein n=1 Tax=Robbsia sp. KACC 23696 TaxID=3149231 RepID=UPI00325C1884
MSNDDRFVISVMRVDERRALIDEAHAARMRLPIREARESAVLSDFLRLEEVTWCWFIHDQCGIPICRSWPREKAAVPTHHVEFRQCWTEMVCTEWQPIPEIAEPTAGALTEYLRGIFGEDPQLHPAGLEQRVVEDDRGYQYRFVTMPKLKLPTRIEIDRLVAQMEMHHE